MNASDEIEAPTRGVRALVVDDSTSLRGLMELTLGPMGISVEFADNGEDALTMIGRREYDIVFLDVILPGIDGYRVCKAIKNDKATRHIPVIMLTGKDTAFDKIRGVMSGSDVYLTKPLQKSALISALNKCLPSWQDALTAEGTA